MEDAIHVESLTKRYRETLAVDGISFRVRRGETVGLLGGNGAGKTTTIAMLLALLVPTSGRITVLGQDMAKDRFAALAKMNFSSPYVALPQRLTVIQNLRVYGNLYSVPQLERRIRELADELDLHGAKNQGGAGEIADQPAGAAAAG
jgi:ABC-2 type transport system ATP-binding protein